MSDIIIIENNNVSHLEDIIRQQESTIKYLSDTTNLLIDQLSTSTNSIASYLNSITSKNTTDNNTIDSSTGSITWEDSDDDDDDDDDESIFEAICSDISTAEYCQFCNCYIDKEKETIEYTKCRCHHPTHNRCLEFESTAGGGIVHCDTCGDTYHHDILVPFHCSFAEWNYLHELHPENFPGIDSAADDTEFFMDV